MTFSDAFFLGALRVKTKYVNTNEDVKHSLLISDINRHYIVTLAFLFTCIFTFEP